MVYLDEVPMPQRPTMPPTMHDREVFVDPFPGEEGSPEMVDWLETFGEADEVFRIPGQDRGYVVFEDPLSAAKCVAVQAATWSESERAIASQRRLRDAAVHAVYPECLIQLMVGKDGSHINEFSKRMGIRRLHVFRGGSSDKRERGKMGRCHFFVWCTSGQLEKFRHFLRDSLLAAHQEMISLISRGGPCEVTIQGLTPDWSAEDLRTRLSGGYEIQSVTRGESLKKNSALIRFRTSSDARSAAASLDATDHLPTDYGGALRCELVCWWNAAVVAEQQEELSEAKGRKSDETFEGFVDGTGRPPQREPGPFCVERCIFIGNLPIGSSENPLRELLKTLGDVVSVMLLGDFEKSCPGYAWGEFASSACCAKALEVLQDFDYNGHHLLAAPADQVLREVGLLLPEPDFDKRLSARGAVNASAPGKSSPTPALGSTPPPPSTVDAPEPQVWEIYVDPTWNLPYFWNRKTGKSTWDAPRGWLDWCNPVKQQPDGSKSAGSCGGEENQPRDEPPVKLERTEMLSATKRKFGKASLPTPLTKVRRTAPVTASESGRKEVGERECEAAPEVPVAAGSARLRRERRRRSARTKKAVEEFNAYVHSACEAAKPDMTTTENERETVSVSEEEYEKVSEEADSDSPSLGRPTRRRISPYVDDAAERANNDHQLPVYLRSGCETPDQDNISGFRIFGVSGPTSSKNLSVDEHSDSPLWRKRGRPWRG